MVEAECHDRRMNHLDLWSKVVHDKMLSEANGFSEITTETLASERPGLSKLPENLARLNFKSQSMPFREVVSTSRSAPYQTFTPSSSATIHESLSMMRYLKRVGRLSEASGAWRTGLLSPGMVVKWVDLPGLYMTFNARMTAVSLWPLTEFKVGKAAFWGLQSDMDCTKLVWRSLLDFKECVVVNFSFATPLRMYLANGLKLPLKTPPVFMQKRPGRGEASVLVSAARRGFQGMGVGILDKVLSLECGLSMSNKSKADKLWAAVQHILGCTDSKVADILEVQVQRLAEDEEYAMLFSTEAASDVIEKGDEELVKQFCESVEDNKKEADALTERIRKTRQTSQGNKPNKLRPAIRFEGDRAVTLSDVQSALPPGAKARRDDHQKRWQIFLGALDQHGTCWSTSKSWGLTGDEQGAADICTRAGWNRYCSLTGAENPTA